MKQILCSLIVALFFCNAIYGQNRDISLGFNYLYFPITTYNFTSERNNYVQIPNFNSLYHHTNIRTEGIRSDDFKVYYNYALGFNWQKSINQNLKFETGINISVFKYSILSKGSVISSVQLTDTVPASEDLLTVFPWSGCDNFGGFYNTSDEPQKTKIIELKIPLELKRIIIKNRLEGFIGGFLGVPIIKNEKFNKVQVLHEIDAQGMENCTASIVTAKNKSLSEVRKLTFGFVCGYDIYFNKLRLGMSVEQRLNNYFSKNSPKFSRPLALNIKLGVRF
jgi:hypothetical protein